MDNVHFDHLYNNTIPNASATVVPQFVKSDPSLFKDDVDIRFNRTLNNCKVPQIRYATPERLLQRLTDLRFLSIDFLNTFLLTYRVFADGVQVDRMSTNSTKYGEMSHSNNLTFGSCRCWRLWKKCISIQIRLWVQQVLPGKEFFLSSISECHYQFNHDF